MKKGINYCLLAEPGKDLMVRLDLGDLTLPKVQMDVAEFLKFKISRYRNLIKLETRSVKWEIMASPVNKVFTKFSDENQIKIAMFMLNAHYDINKFMNRTDIVRLPELMNQLSRNLAELDSEIDLWGTLEKFITDGNIPLGDYSKAGLRPQDTAEMTFTEEDGRKVTVIALISKILAPIYGVLMSFLLREIDVQLKEVHCAVILTDILKNRCLELVLKLRTYTKNVSNSGIHRTQTNVFHNVSLENMVRHTMSNLYTRAFVNIDLYRPFTKNEGNIMIFIIVTVKQIIRGREINAKKTAFMTRTPFGENDGEEGSRANIELDSQTSIGTCDQAILPMASIPPLINKFLIDYDIEEKQFITATEWYHKHPIVPNVTNQHVINHIFGTYLGGWQSIKLLDHINYVKLACLAQLVVLQFGYYELLTMLTVIPTKEPKLKLSSTDDRVKLSAKTSEQYRACRARSDASPLKDGGKRWDRMIDDYLESTLYKGYLHNTADNLWELMDSTNLNGRKVQPTQKLITSVCAITLVTF